MMSKLNMKKFNHVNANILKGPLKSKWDPGNNKSGKARNDGRVT